MGYLTAAQKTAFSARVIDGTKFRRVVELNDGTNTYDVTDRVISFGRMTEALTGYAIAGEVRLQYPAVAIRCRNNDGYLTPGAASGLWPNGDLDGWTLRLRVYESLSGSSETLLYDQTFALASPEVRQDEATLIATTLLAGYWLKEFERETHRHAIDWNGYPHSVSF